MILRFDEYTRRTSGTPEQHASVARMSDAELQRIYDSFQEWRALPYSHEGNRPPGAELGIAARQEILSRTINRRMNAAGRSWALRSGIVVSLAAALAKRPRWWLYGAIGAVLGYGRGRATAAPQGRW